MKHKPSQNEELRSEIREAAAQGASVEFKPSTDAMSYRLTLRDWSPSGLGILVKTDSDLCRLLSVGQVFDMMVHRGEGMTPPEYVRVEIRHISEPATGQHPGHLIVGLYIRERMDKTTAEGQGI